MMRRRGRPRRKRAWDFCGIRSPAASANTHSDRLYPRTPRLPFEPLIHRHVALADDGPAFWQSGSHDPAGRTPVSAHALLTEIDEAAIAYDRTRFRDQGHYLAEKDAHTKRIRALVRQLRRKIGTSEELTLTTGDRLLGSRMVKVVTRSRIPGKPGSKSGRKAA